MQFESDVAVFPNKFVTIPNIAYTAMDNDRAITKDLLNIKSKLIPEPKIFNYF